MISTSPNTRAASALLTREGEVAIAKRIERVERMVIRALSRTRLVSREVLRLREKLNKNENQLIDMAEAPSRAFRQVIEASDKDGDDALSKEEFDELFEVDVKAGALRAVRLGGKEDVTGTHVVWRYARSLPDVPSPLLYDNVIYSLRNGAILTALDAQTGREVDWWGSGPKKTAATHSSTA